MNKRMHASKKKNKQTAKRTKQACKQSKVAKQTYVKQSEKRTYEEKIYMNLCIIYVADLNKYVINIGDAYRCNGIRMYGK